MRSCVRGFYPQSALHARPGAKIASRRRAILASISPYWCCTTTTSLSPSDDDIFFIYFLLDIFDCAALVLGIRRRIAFDFLAFHRKCLVAVVPDEKPEGARVKPEMRNDVARRKKIPVTIECSKTLPTLFYFSNPFWSPLHIVGYKVRLYISIGKFI